jgi:hypothetical protein
MVTEMREGLDVDMVRSFVKFLGPKDDEQEEEAEGEAEAPHLEKQATVIEEET